ILAEPARSLLAQLFLSPAMGRRRVLLVLSAERLHEESGNALLKVLEEPPRSAVFILMCENRWTLLPTIRSRCHAVRFGTLARGDVARFLEREAGVARADATLLAGLSGGRIGAALSLTRQSSEYRERRARWLRVLGEARKLGTAAAALSAAGDFQSGGSESLDDLSILSDLLRDAMLAGSGSPPDRLTDPDFATSTWGSPYTPH